LPKNTASEKQSEDMKQLFDSITADNVIKINPTDALLKASEDTDIYYRLDHHWTTEGAYIGYKELCKGLGITPTPLEEYTKTEVTNDFFGTIYSKINDYSVSGDTITAYTNDNWDLDIDYDGEKSDSLFNDEYLQKKDKYSYFLDNLHPYIKIENKNAKSDKSLAVIKDSYANCLVPFLVDEYKTIYVFDTRYYRESVSEFINQNDVDNVAVIYNMNTIDTDMGVRGIY
jgi:hypothetical protein